MTLHDLSILDGGRRAYLCAECGRAFRWGQGSAWFGTLQDIEVGKPVRTVCSDACRVAHAAALGVDPEPIADE